MNAHFFFLHIYTDIYNYIHLYCPLQVLQELQNACLTPSVTNQLIYKSYYCQRVTCCPWVLLSARQSMHGNKLNLEIQLWIFPAITHFNFSKLLPFLVGCKFYEADILLDCSHVHLFVQIAFNSLNSMLPTNHCRHGSW